MSFYGARESGMSTNSIFGAVDEFDEGTVTDRNYTDYCYGRPAYEGTATACFDEGLLFRIVEEGRTTRWSFYNDTPNCQMRVEVTFDDESNIKALQNTSMRKNSDGSYTCSVIVYPLETELFIEGEPGGYTSNIKAEELSDNYLEDLVVENKGTIEKETYDIYNLVGSDVATDETLRACVAKRIKFVDFAFPPEQESLQIGSLIELKMIPWLRPCMYLSDENAKQARLFRNGVHPNNIDEGDLGDSWFVGAVACVAEFPDKVRDLFRHPLSLDEGKKEREVGAYRVTFNKNGWWTNVIVDDYLPCAGGRPKFARSKGDPLELWVSILEKAYAKIHGGYGFIIAGDPLHALQDLTGYPCSSFNNAFIEASTNGGMELFGHLLQYNSFGYQAVMTTPTRELLMRRPNGLSEEFYERVGLYLGHVYAVLKIMYFPQYDLRMLHVRNPWVREHGPRWQGLWKRGDSKWKQYRDVANACNYNEEEDGSFFLEWGEAINLFTGCGVCFIQDPMYDFRIRGCFMQSVPTTCLEITVGVPVIMCVMLSQDDRRGTDKAEYSPIMISIAHGCGALSPMRVDLNSGFDTDHPTQEYTFFETRETSLFYEFLPENSPYLVVPRTMSSYAELPYVLGLRSPIAVGTPNTHVHVGFRALAPGSPLFDNIRTFDAITVPCQTEFQALAPEQFFPDIYAGTIIQVDDS
ncbi:calpain-like cysteine peptidase [Trypanosoma theileri]|uniref:Calpain-like cysteine peptidase n=1 Tax=Trypanosoma theileri TaxID=67003 RepID=A0A1X0NW84_9TRYP|nr:calpain-like cysteine peptidase [Trypanosoma theileri]ORC88965.1 calpain-like cysteine peptidase [Trypanosoma theileri]